MLFFYSRTTSPACTQLYPSFV